MPESEVCRAAQWKYTRKVSNSSKCHGEHEDQFVKEIHSVLQL